MVRVLSIVTRVQGAAMALASWAGRGNPTRRTLNIKKSSAVHDSCLFSLGVFPFGNPEIENRSAGVLVPDRYLQPKLHWKSRFWDIGRVSIVLLVCLLPVGHLVAVFYLFPTTAMGEAENSVLNKLHNSVLFFVAPVLRGGVGPSLERVTISNIFSGSKASSVEPDGDHFTCHIGYCGTILSWEVIFDATRPRSCPDVIVAGTDDNSFSPALSDIPALCNWDASNPLSLLHVLNELLDAYRQHNLQELVKLAPAVAEQAQRLADLHIVPLFDVLPVPPPTDQPNVDRSPFALMSIPMPIDLSMLPAYMIPANPGPACANLQLTFYTPMDNPYVAIRMDLSLQLQHALHGTVPFVLPAWGSDGHGSLQDYVPNIRQLLLDKIEQICESYALRRDYIMAFCEVYGRALLEFDSESFKKMSFIVVSPISPCSLALHFIVYIELTSQFPSVCPRFTIQSVYHQTTAGRPASRVFEGAYPYSPRWSGDEMADRSRVFLIENTLRFSQDLMPANSKDQGVAVIS